jgi:hypothetical protein
VLSRQCGLPDTPYGQHKSSGSHVDPMLARDLPYGAIGSPHLLVQFLVDPFFIPSELLDVLRPLEIAHGDATSVGEDVRNDQDAPVVQDLAGFGRCRPILDILFKFEGTELRQNIVPSEVELEAPR